MTLQKDKQKTLLHEGNTVKIRHPHAAWRIDRALSKMLPAWSRAGIGELVRRGGVKLNGMIVRKGSRKLKVGDEIEVDPALREHLKKERDFARDVEDFAFTGRASAVKPEDIPLDIVYEDQDMLVVDKPAGMVVHPAYANTSGTLANAIAGYFTRKGIKLFRRVGLVHRLDKDVTGLVLVAKHADALRVLSEQFSGEGIETNGLDTSRKAEKVYWAVVGPVEEGRLKEAGLGPDAGRKKVEGLIWRSPGDRKKSVFVENREVEPPAGAKARYALSYMKYEKALGKGLHLIDVQIVTGRTHQIRAQLASLGLPIEGDVLYDGVARRKVGIALRCVRMSVIPIRVYEGLLEKEDLTTVIGENIEGGAAVPEKVRLSSERIVIKKEEMP